MSNFETIAWIPLSPTHNRWIHEIIFNCGGKCRFWPYFCFYIAVGQFRCCGHHSLYLFNFVYYFIVFFFNYIQMNRLYIWNSNVSGTFKFPIRFLFLSVLKVRYISSKGFNSGISVKLGNWSCFKFEWWDFWTYLFKINHLFIENTQKKICAIRPTP